MGVTAVYALKRTRLTHPGSVIVERDSGRRYEVPLDPGGWYKAKEWEPGAGEVLELLPAAVQLALCKFLKVDMGV